MSGAAWSFEPTALLGLGVVAVLYARGLRRSAAERVLWRVASFYVGLLVIFIALVSPLASIAHELFVAHMVQHLLLIMIAAPLVLLGAPSLPLLQGLPRSVRAELVRPLARRRLVRKVLHGLTNPLIAFSTYIVLLTMWHLPGWYDGALRDAWLHLLEHATFLFIAFLFWAQIVDPAPWRAPLAYPLRIVFLFAATAHNTILGGILSFSPPLYASYFERGERLFGLTAAADQQWGGIIMWVPGGMLHLVAISIVFAVWLSAEDRAPIQSGRLPDHVLR